MLVRRSVPQGSPNVFSPNFFLCRRQRWGGGDADSYRHHPIAEAVAAASWLIGLPLYCLALRNGLLVLLLFACGGLLQLPLPPRSSWFLLLNLSQT